jgi:hypothetical protein
MVRKRPLLGTATQRKPDFRGCASTTETEGLLAFVIWDVARRHEAPRSVLLKRPAAVPAQTVPGAFASTAREQAALAFHSPWPAKVQVRPASVLRKTPP